MKKVMVQINWQLICQNFQWTDGLPDGPHSPSVLPYVMSPDTAAADRSGIFYDPTNYLIVPPPFFINWSHIIIIITNYY